MDEDKWTGTDPAYLNTEANRDNPSLGFIHGSWSRMLDSELRYIMRFTQSKPFEMANSEASAWSAKWSVKHITRSVHALPLPLAIDT